LKFLSSIISKDPWKTDSPGDGSRLIKGSLRRAVLPL
jgi:hypothetical protein